MKKSLLFFAITAVILSGCSEQTQRDEGKRPKETQKKSTNSVGVLNTETKQKNMDIKKFKQNWGVAAVPTELESLINFQNNNSAPEFYSRGFAVTIDDKLGLKSWSDDPAFLANLFPFAQANGTGSFYAIWNDGTAKSIEEMPIVVFGDEGGAHIVAENLRQLFELLTFDSEICVDLEQAYFHKTEGQQESRDLDKFLRWLQENFGLKQSQHTAKIITSAQEKYKEPFDNWFERFYKIE
ncbi:hypothetical protein [Sphingobacterium deserti]|uniref:Uncharacterized protein n=1 Tax=Sphingobacterium deserti TaxID=1229276 RepID=A0A0B8T534_9SPHI|nr:hypothetical protein [Sphingobacterium deserti]KGE12514.1 hypothetical protein DI53_3554 [Sphingobacterium deserti]